MRKAMPKVYAVVEKLAPWTQAVLTLIIVLYLYLDNQAVLAETVGIIGSFLTLGYLALSVLVDREVKKVSVLMDLPSPDDIVEIKNVIRAYNEVGQSKFAPYKSQAIHECTDYLHRLSNMKMIELKTGDYYVKLREMLQKAPPDEKIRAVSTVSEDAWTSLRQMDYLEECIAAAKREVVIERIFVTTDERLKNRDFQEVLSKHKENMVGRVALDKHLQEADSRLVGQCGDGFVIFGSRAVMIDSWKKDEKQGGHPYEGSGILSENPMHISDYALRYKRLRFNSRKWPFAM